MEKVKKVGLALQGGGAHGAFTWGILDRLLEEEQIFAEGICGTSAGAVNAVALAYGLHTGGPDKAKQVLNSLWKQVSKFGSFFFEPSFLDKNQDIYNSPGYLFINSLTQHFSPYTFNPFNYNPLRDILESLIDFEELRHYNKKKLFICATNVRTNHARIFHNEEITVEAVLASCCLPFLFQAVEIEGQHYWDGGYMGNPPIFPLIKETDAHDILLIKVNSMNIDQLPTTARDISDRINEISFNSSLVNELKLIHYRNELLKAGVKIPNDSNKEIFIHTISGYDHLKSLSYSSKMNTSWNFLYSLKLKGRDAAQKWLEQKFPSVGTKSTFDITEHYIDKVW